MAVRKTSPTRTFAATPSNFSPSSIVSSNSPMPNSPITAIRKLTPASSTSNSKVRRTLPETESMPMVASAKPIAIETTVLKGEAPPSPMKLAKVMK